MKIKVPVPFLIQLKKEKNLDDVESLRGLFRLSVFRSIDFNTDELRVDAVDFLLDLAKKDVTSPSPCFFAQSKALIRKIEAIRSIEKKSKFDDVKCKKLDEFEAALKVYLEPLPNHWVFTSDDAGNLIPWFVKNIINSPGGKWSAPSVDLNLMNSTLGKDTSKSFHISVNQLKGGKSPREIMDEIGVLIETPDLVKSYFSDIEKYKTIQPQTGMVFTGTGEANTLDTSTSMSLEFDGIASKLVIDDEEHQNTSSKDNTGVCNNNFWDYDDSKNKKDQEPGSVILPISPFLVCFNLRENDFCIVHVNVLKPYVFIKDLHQKLVIPDDHKEVIEILMENAKDSSEDIIRGKTGGSFVLSTGSPGIGKTLTAEIYAEQLERPLYCVQCAELGIDIDKIESNLDEILRRAERWNALLLIDEADVYVRARGDDIVQNAIVGVFLRLIERYRGVIFMTSNREDEIDDAILSRASAHLRFAIPSTDEQREIWKILSKNYKIDLQDDVIEYILGAAPGHTGRNIKNILKLMRAYQNRKIPITIEVFNKLIKFIDYQTNS